MFAQRLRELRRECGLTQIQLAQKLHVSNGTIGMWETGKREPDFDTTKRLADFFHVSTDYLLGNVNNPFFVLDNQRILDEINSSERTFEEKAPILENGRRITIDDFTYAMQEETKDLTAMDKQILLSMAKQLNDARKQQSGEPR